MDELLKAGERTFQMQRALSCKLGITAKDDILPELAMRPIPEGGQEGHVPNMEKDAAGVLCHQRLEQGYRQAIEKAVGELWVCRKSPRPLGRNSCTIKSSDNKALESIMNR
jgi:hypothetical protein